MTKEKTENNKKLLIEARSFLDNIEAKGGPKKDFYRVDKIQRKLEEAMENNNADLVEFYLPHLFDVEYNFSDKDPSDPHNAFLKELLQVNRLVIIISSSLRERRSSDLIKILTNKLNSILNSLKELGYTDIEEEEMYFNEIIFAASNNSYPELFEFIPKTWLHFINDTLLLRNLKAAIRGNFHNRSNIPNVELNRRLETVKIILNNIEYISQQELCDALCIAAKVGDVNLTNLILNNNIQKLSTESLNKAFDTILEWPTGSNIKNISLLALHGLDINKGLGLGKSISQAIEIGVRAKRLADLMNLSMVNKSMRGFNQHFGPDNVLPPEIFEKIKGFIATKEDVITEEALRLFPGDISKIVIKNLENLDEKGVGGRSKNKVFKYLSVEKEAIKLATSYVREMQEKEQRETKSTTNADPTKEVDQNGNTMLHNALTLRNLVEASNLIKNGANIYAQNNEGVTPLGLIQANNIVNITQGADNIFYLSTENKSSDSERVEINNKTLAAAIRKVAEKQNTATRPESSPKNPEVRLKSTDLSRGPE